LSHLELTSIRELGCHVTHALQNRSPALATDRSRDIGRTNRLGRPSSRQQRSYRRRSSTPLRRFIRFIPICTPALAQRDLCVLNTRPRRGFSLRIAVALRGQNRPTRTHQLTHQLRPKRIRNGWIASPPSAAIDHDVAFAL
jgi:hypothetical protein